MSGRGLPGFPLDLGPGMDAGSRGRRSDVRVHDTEAETWSMAYAQESKRWYSTGAGEPRSTT